MIGNIVVYINKWLDANVLKIGDLTSVDGTLLTHEEFHVRYPAIN